MDRKSVRHKKDWKGANGDGVFVKKWARFIISDDLNVMVASTRAILNLVEKLGIKDGNILEEMMIELGRKQLRNLLKRSLHSTSPLSDFCFQKTDMIDSAMFPPKCKVRPKFEEVSVEETKKIKANLFVCKFSNRLVYAESGNGGALVDLLFSFLTFPLGSIIKLLDKNTTIGCIDNLYRSVEHLTNGSDCLKSGGYKNMLLAPKLAPYFGCRNLPIPNNELSTRSCKISGCHTCFIDKIGTSGTDTCKHGVEHIILKEMNPKRVASEEVGGNYANEAVKFMITDDLQVTPFSAVSSIRTAKELQVSFTNLEEIEICIGAAEALNLLRSCLTSQNSLSSVFLRKKKTKRKN